ncbi:cyclic dehypoxanthinyl futalosine synthase [Pasteuria penetrans]|uniref:cyclic dehypoxanthinyl futalosine synthase n=1 Tax=Pasteuria penetrans TaxID=86005 RepID=UPI000FC3BFA2
MVRNVDRVLEKALCGQRLNEEDALLLWECKDIEKLGRIAHQIRLRKNSPDRVTFVVGRNINYTNVCDTYCRFCAFYRAPGKEGGYVLSEGQLVEKIRATVAAGGTEILLQGGTHPDLPFSYYKELLRIFKKHAPSLHMHAFTAIEIEKMMEVSGLPLMEVLRQLKEAGLDSIPGGGAEILDDSVRRKVSPVKGSWRRWMRVMQAAHRVGLHTTATMVIGLGENSEQRVQHLLRLRDAQDSTRGFLAFIVWTFQPGNSQLSLPRLSDADYLQAVAVARLVLDNIPHFQSSWVTMGPEIGKQSLYYGCDDFGSTMMEENVVSAAGTTYPMNARDAVRLIREAGFLPVQRNTRYEDLRCFPVGEEPEKDFSLGEMGSVCGAACTSS